MVANKYCRFNLFLFHFTYHLSITSNTLILHIQRINHAYPISTGSSGYAELDYGCEPS